MKNIPQTLLTSNQNGDNYVVKRFFDASWRIYVCGRGNWRRLFHSQNKNA